MGLFDKFKQGLKKTTQLLNTDIRDLFKSTGRLLDEVFLEELFAALIKTDMGVEAARATRDEIGREFRGRVVHMEDLLAAVKTKLESLMPPEPEAIRFAAAGPTVVMVVGVNGSGKTTSIAKLARWFQDQGKTVLLGAADTFRAAAVEQLGVWGQRLGAEVVRGPQGTDPASVAHRAVARALETGADVCIVDTAGRLQTQTNLMQELGKVHRVIGKLVPEAPHEVLLVLDATGGQNGISQARGFTEAVRCSGIVLAKIDGSAKGGVVIPIWQQFKLPVKFLGVGEQATDLAPFQPHEFVEALFADLETAGAK
jgi:fused signal recognition particle receptor